MMRTIDYEQIEMWDSVQTLSKINREQAKVVLKATIERSFRQVGIVLPKLSGRSLRLPEQNELNQLKQLEKKLNNAAEQQKINDDLLAEYIDGLIQLTANNQPQFRKAVTVSLLKQRRIKRRINRTAPMQAIMISSLKGETKPFYTPKEVGKKLGLSDQTIRRLCEKGKFSAAYQTEGGHWRIPRDAFITTSKQDEQAETVLHEIDEKNRRGGDIDEFNL
ncbi:MAG: helix-turn-helix domain-containing protein [Sporolactobacillus sp.]|uniref:helix-turn-helix domain-containing protein n=1 Tax=Sporolactobacillus sp. STSJ-5 TaxID=2965076 RepID=UPI0021027419|nr:helix-turn-helix domain-containing protein [Sporolactobacillus sp. STSJ-5]MCQ2011672.1 helix-turn-helix domain-containing protein [Sporolactobacillus sp. STSJ-5]